LTRHWDVFIFVTAAITLLPTDRKAYTLIENLRLGGRLQHAYSTAKQDNLMISLPSLENYRPQVN
jgi:hypothetical protein